MSTLQIDGDGILYRAGFAVEKTAYLVTEITNIGKILPIGMYENRKDCVPAVHGLVNPKVWSRQDVETESKALLLTDLILGDIKARYPEYTPHVWLTPGVGNFRERIATRAKYKGNRETARRPVHYKAIRQYLIDKYGAREAWEQEADDALGIAATEDPKAIIVSFDKDLLQVPGTHYNWVTKEEKYIGRRAGDMNFWTQVLTGDATDNVPGIPGVGPVKAGRILQYAKSNYDAWVAVGEAYGSHFGQPAGIAYAIEAAQLVWVRRKPNELWSIPQSE